MSDNGTATYLGEGPQRFSLARAWTMARSCPCDGDDHNCPHCATTEGECPRCGDDLDDNWYCSQGYCPDCCEETDTHEEEV